MPILAAANAKHTLRKKQVVVAGIELPPAAIAININSVCTAFKVLVYMTLIKPCTGAIG